MPVNECTIADASVLAMPRQFGPHTTIPCAAAILRISSWAARPGSPASPKPALMISAAGMPFRPQVSSTSSTARCGTTSTARSGVSGSASIDGWQGSPSIEACRGLTR
jgi:hypothetical protein